MSNTTDIIVFDCILDVLNQFEGEFAYGKQYNFINQYYRSGLLRSSGSDMAFYKKRLAYFDSDCMLRSMARGQKFNITDVEKLRVKANEILKSGEPDYQSVLLFQNINLIRKYKSFSSPAIDKMSDIVDSYLADSSALTDKWNNVSSRAEVFLKVHPVLVTASPFYSDIDFEDYFTARDLCDELNFFGIFCNDIISSDVPVSDAKLNFYLKYIGKFTDVCQYVAAAQVLNEAELGIADERIKRNYGYHFDLVPFAGIKGATLCKDSEYCNRVLNLLNKRNFSPGFIHEYASVDFLAYLCDYSNTYADYCSDYYKNGLGCVNLSYKTKDLVQRIDKAKDIHTLDNLKLELQGLIDFASELTRDMKKNPTLDKHMENNLKVLKQYSDGFVKIADMIHAKQTMLKLKPAINIERITDKFKFDDELSV